MVKYRLTVCFVALMSTLGDWSSTTMTVDASDSREFSYTIDMADNSDPLDMSIRSTNCADACQVGDSIMINGDLTIYQEFTETVCMTLVLSAYGNTATATGKDDFCTTLGVESVDGSTECPDPGDYTFSFPLTVNSLSTGKFALHAPEQPVNYKCISFLKLMILHLFLFDSCVYFRSTNACRF